ncbi:MAG: septum formation initiator family protein [bacterium]|nr:septum formation initiator family protein [bacterium]
MPQRAHREVQRAAAHRGGARRPRGLPRRGLLLQPVLRRPAGARFKEEPWSAFPASGPRRPRRGGPRPSRAAPPPSAADRCDAACACPCCGSAGRRSCVLLYTTLTGTNGLHTYLDLRREQLRLEQEVADLQRRRAEIVTGLVALRDTADTETLERVAREKYRMRRPQEKVIEIVGEDALAPPPAAAGE